MASLIKKKKGNRLYYYLVESARVDGQPRIVHQAYLGTAEKLAELVQQKSAPSPSPPPCATSASPAPCGWLPNSPACGRYWNPCGPLRVPAPARLTTSCTPPFTASAIPVRRPKSATGTSRPSSLPSGVFLPSALLRKPSGTPSNRFCRSRARPWLPQKILWIVRSCVYSDCGRRSNWSVTGCWLQITHRG